MNYKSVYSISVLFILALTGGYLITQNQNYTRVNYEKAILKKAQKIKPQLDLIDKDKKSPNQPDMAAFQEYTMTVDPKTGNVPKKRLLDAYHLTQSMEAEQVSTRNLNSLMNWETSGSNMGGRTRALMFDPNDPNNTKVWAGGVTGGLWYVNDIEDTNEDWKPVDDFWSNLAISCITYDPNDPQIMYVGTGEAQTARIIYRASSGVGAGIFKTNDGGQTWNLMDSTSGFDYITDIAVKDENGTSIIYACVASGTYEGEDHESHPSDGLYRSEDGGDTWDQVLPVIPQSLTNKPYAPADIEISANGRIFIGTMENLDKQGGATILYSDSGLEGSWTTYAEYYDLISNESYYKIPARTLVATAPSDPNTVYAQFAAGYNNGFVYYRGRYMVKSIDGGTTWTQLTIPDDGWSTLAWHAFVLKVDPQDPNSIYTGGLDLWKSTNGGDMWSHISDWSEMYSSNPDDSYVHADQHNIQFQPGTPTTAIFGSDGGVFLTKKANLTYPEFIERNQGLSTLQFYSCAIKPTPFSTHYIGGLQDNGTLLHKGQPLIIQNMVTGGDGAFCFWDQNQANIFITSVYYNKYYFFSNENYADDLDDASGTFISPADYDYKENILYSNACDFFGGNVNKILRVTEIPFNVSRERVNINTSVNVPFSHISYSRFSPTGTSTLFVGTQAGNLFKVTNAESDPQTIEIGISGFPYANISCVAIGESEDNLLVTFSNYGVSSVWLTTDGGDTWIEKEGNLPDMPIRWAIFHPDNNGQALLATEIGVWWTNTLNEEITEWQPSVDGMANVRVDMLKLRNGDDFVLAATHGRGLFTAEYPLDIYVGEDEKPETENEFTIYPNPVTDYISISANDNYERLELSLFDISGRLIIETKVENNSTRVYLPEVIPGIYIAIIKADDLVEKQKIVIR